MSVEEFELDQDGDFNFDNLDDGVGFDDSAPPAGRTPLDHIGRVATESFIGDAANERTANEMIHQALPKGYGQAWDAGVNAKETISGIYDKSIEGLKPSFSILRSIGRKGLPLANKLLPQGLVDQLEEMTAEPERRDVGAEVDPNESEISNTLATIFDVQRTTDLQQQAKDDATDIKDDEVDRREFAVTIDTQGQIASGISRLVGYQDSVLSAYHRKSLELQHRQYFTTRDSYAYDRSYGADVLAALEDVVFNTGLPNEVKVNNSEVLNKLATERLIGGIQESVLSRLGNVPATFRSNLMAAAGEAVDSANDAFGDIGEMFEGDEGVPGAEDIAGSMAGERGRSFASKRMSKYIFNLIKDNPRIAALGSNLQFQTENATRRFNEFAQDEGGGITEFLRSLITPVDRDGETVVHNLATDPTAAVGWDLLSRRTLIEIIPGYLSRQLEQLTNIATGRENERVIYSTSREEFVDRSVAVRDVERQINETTDVRVAGEARDIVNTLVANTEDGSNLSSEGQLDLMMQLIQRSESGKIFDPTAIIEDNDSSEASTINSILEEYFKITTNVETGDQMVPALDRQVQDRMLSVGKKFNELTGRVGLNDQVINRFVSTGEKDLLRSAGVISNESGTDTVLSQAKWSSARQVISDELERMDAMVESTEPEDPIPPTSDPIEPFMGPVVPPPVAPVVDSVTIDSLETPVESPVPPAPQNHIVEELDSAEEPIVPVSTTAVPTIQNSISFSSNWLDEVLDHQVQHSGLLERVAVGIEGILSNGITTLTIDPSMIPAGSTGFFGRAGELVMSGVKKIPSILGGARDYAGTAAGRAVGLVGIAGRTAGTGISKAYDYITNEVDLHLDTLGGSPVLSAARLRRGEYWDTVTGEVLESWDDIRGSVSDASGVVLSVEEWGGGERLIAARGAIKKAMGRGWDALKSAHDRTFNLIRKLPTGVGFVKDQLLGLVSRPRDVYLRNQMESPILFKSGFRSGLYSSKGTGAVLTSQIYIDGPVMAVDSTGEQELYEILSTAQLRQGLVYSDGTEVKFDTPLGLLTDLGLRGFNIIKEHASKRLDQAKAVVKLVGSAAGRTLRGAAEGLTGMDFGSTQSPSVVIGGDHLTNIYELLQSWTPSITGVLNSESVDPVMPAQSVVPSATVEASPPVDSMQSSFASNVDVVQNAVDNTRSTISQVVSNVTDRTSNIAEVQQIVNAGNVVGDAISNSVNVVRNDVSSVVDSVQQVLTDARNSGSTVSILESVHSAMSQVANDRMESSELLSNITESLSTVNLSTDTVNSVVQELQTLVNAGVINVTDIRETISGIPGISQILPGAELVATGEFIGPLPIPAPAGNGVESTTGETTSTNMLSSLQLMISNRTDSTRSMVSDVTSSITTQLDSMTTRIVEAVSPSEQTEVESEQGRRGSYFDILRRRNAETDEDTDAPTANGGLDNRVGGSIRNATDGATTLPRGIMDKLVQYAPLIIPAAIAATSAFVGSTTAKLSGGDDLAVVTAGTVAGAIALGATGLITAPIAVGVAATATAGFLAYRAFKAVQRRKPLQPLEQLRFLQYGVPVQLQDAVIAMRYLEHRIRDEVSVTIDGVPQFDWDRTLVMWSRFYGDFGGVENNPEQRDAFERWFYLRFLPVYVAHLKMAMMLGVDLETVDGDLPPLDQSILVSGVQFGGDRSGLVDPYVIADSPWPAIGLVDNLEAIDQLSLAITTAGYAGADADLEPINAIVTDPLVVQPEILRGDISSVNSAVTDITTSAEIPPVAPKLYTVKPYKSPVIDEQVETAEIPPVPNVPNVPKGKLLMPTTGTVSSPFGNRVDPINGGQGVHKGIDIAAPSGTPVYAAADGIVTRSAYSQSYGNVVYIKHSDGRVTRYAHLSDMAPRLKALGNRWSTSLPVAQGEEIGYVGSTGARTTGPHLHFELRKDSSDYADVLNPMPLFNDGVEDVVVAGDETADDTVGTPIQTAAVEPVVIPTFEPNVVTAGVEQTVNEISTPVETLSALGTPSQTIKIGSPDLTGLDAGVNEARIQRGQQLTALETNNLLMGELISAIQVKPLPADADSSEKQQRALEINVAAAKTTESATRRSVVNFNKQGA